MKQALTAEIAAPRQSVWTALAREVDGRGRNVELLESQAPERLRLIVHMAAGESLEFVYVLTVLDDRHTAVAASVQPRGLFYALKRTLSFGAVEHGYLAAVAAGLDNLRRHVEGPPPSQGTAAEDVAD